MARADLYFFSRWMFSQRKGYQWQRAAHHKLICDALMRVFLGLCKRLIINIPPRYSKTELAVTNFIAWAMGQVPDAEFIHTSYSATLAVNNAVGIRAMVQHEAYQEIFPGIELASEAGHHWKTTDGGVMYATGTGGTITGFGAGKHRSGFGGAIVIDDPHKADEARSDVIRQGVIDWFQNTLESRKNSPETPIIVIMQRLHQADLAGWLLEGGNGEQWEHLCLSVWNEDETPLWPEKHSAEVLARMEMASPYVFAGQYRQQPVPAGGALFNPDKIGIIDAVPIGTRFCRGWDLAGTPGAGDWTVGYKMGRMPDGRFLIADVVRFQGGPHEVKATVLATAQRDGTDCRIRLPQDPGQAGKSQAQSFLSALAGYSAVARPVTGDKVARASPLASQVNVGNVVMLRASWNQPLLEEKRMFPSGKYDDQVDAGADAFNELAEPSELGFLEYAEAELKRMGKL
jgi:predicted phage terminase large subunit-like protein